MRRNPIEQLEFGREMLQSELATENWKKEHNMGNVPDCYREKLEKDIREYDKAIKLLKEEKNGQK